MAKESPQTHSNRNLIGPSTTLPEIVSDIRASPNDSPTETGTVGKLGTEAFCGNRSKLILSEAGIAVNRIRQKARAKTSGNSTEEVFDS